MYEAELSLSGAVTTSATSALQSCAGKLCLFPQISVLQVFQNSFHILLRISSVTFATLFFGLTHSRETPSPHSSHCLLDVWSRESSCLDLKFNMTKTERNHSIPPGISSPIFPTGKESSLTPLFLSPNPKWNQSPCLCEHYLICSFLPISLVLAGSHTIITSPLDF